MEKERDIEESSKFLFHRLGICLCTVTQPYKIVCVSYIEVVSFSLFSPLGTKPLGDIQVFGFHIPI